MMFWKMVFGLVMALHISMEGSMVISMFLAFSGFLKIGYTILDLQWNFSGIVVVCFFWFPVPQTRDYGLLRVFFDDHLTSKVQGMIQHG